MPRRFNEFRNKVREEAKDFKYNVAEFLKDAADYVENGAFDNDRKSAEAAAKKAVHQTIEVVKDAGDYLRSAEFRDSVQDVVESVENFFYGETYSKTCYTHHTYYSGEYYSYSYTYTDC